MIRRLLEDLLIRVGTWVFAPAKQERLATVTDLQLVREQDQAIAMVSAPAAEVISACVDPACTLHDGAAQS